MDDHKRTSRMIMIHSVVYTVSNTHKWYKELANNIRLGITFDKLGQKN